MSHFFIFYSFFTTLVIIFGVYFHFTKIGESDVYIKQLQDEIKCLISEHHLKSITYR
ncbi:MAG: hypothetical protein RIQ94_3056 [Pseudomonadota bacterium]